MRFTITALKKGTDYMTGRETLVLVVETDDGVIDVSFKSLEQLIRLRAAQENGSHGDAFTPSTDD